MSTHLYGKFFLSIVTLFFALLVTTGCAHKSPTQELKDEFVSVAEDREFSRSSRGTDGSEHDPLITQLNHWVSEE